MKRVLIATLVGAIIFFVYQTAVWMSGVHSGVSKYNPGQDAILEAVSATTTEAGMYMLPAADPASPTFKQDQQRIWEEGVGEPWVMLFYHDSLPGMEMGFMLKGFLFSLLGCFIVCYVLSMAGFDSFGKRFTVSMAFALFALMLGVLDNMNWWSYPWHFVQPEVIDMTVGWAIVSGMDSLVHEISAEAAERIAVPDRALIADSQVSARSLCHRDDVRALPSIAPRAWSQSSTFMALPATGAVVRKSPGSISPLDSSTST